MAERNITIGDGGEFKTLDGLPLQPGDNLYLMDFKADVRSFYGTAAIRDGRLMVGVPEVTHYGQRISGITTPATQSS